MCCFSTACAVLAHQLQGKQHTTFPCVCHWQSLLRRQPCMHALGCQQPAQYIMLLWKPCMQDVLGSTVVSPYVGMGRKQNGGYNASISVQTLIFHLLVNSTRLKTVWSALWRCPNTTVALRLLENVVKVTNLEVVKIVFCHLLTFFLLQPA